MHVPQRLGWNPPSTTVTPSPNPLRSYEADPPEDSYGDLKRLAVGEPLQDIQEFLEPNGYEMVKLEATYQSVMLAVPKRSYDLIQCF
jgi:hypothetical protein